jgi:drug/metabolite transporter (DMT)-like permease
MPRASIVRLSALALLWGSSFLWIKIGLRGFSPVQLVLIRLALGFAILLPIVLAKGLRFPRKPAIWGHLVVAALVANAIPYLLFGIGEQTIGSNVAGLINATTPLWTVVVAFVAGTGRTVTLTRALGLGLGFVGTVLIFSPWESATELVSWGGLACLAAAASYGVSYVYMGKYLTGQGIPALVLSTSQLFAASMLLALAVPVAGMQPITWRADAVLSVVVLGVLGTGVAYVLNYRLIADEGPATASITTYLLPVVAVALGYLVLAEPVTVLMMLGITLVLLGVFLAQRSRAA